MQRRTFSKLFKDNMDKLISDNDISIATVGVYSVLVHLSDINGIVRFSQAYLCNATNTDKKTLRKHIQILVQKNLIYCDNSFDPYNQKRNYIIQIANYNTLSENENFAFNMPTIYKKFNGVILPSEKNKLMLKEIDSLLNSR